MVSFYPPHLGATNLNLLLLEKQRDQGRVTFHWSALQQPLDSSIKPSLLPSAQQALQIA